MLALNGEEQAVLLQPLPQHRALDRLVSSPEPARQVIAQVARSQERAGDAQQEAQEEEQKPRPLFRCGHLIEIERSIVHGAGRCGVNVTTCRKAGRAYRRRQGLTLLGVRSLPGCYSVPDARSRGPRLAVWWGRELGNNSRTKRGRRPNGATTGGDHGGRGAGLPQLQLPLPGEAGVRGGGVHGRPDSGHRGPPLSARARRNALPRRRSDRCGGGTGGAHRGAGGGGGLVLLLRHLPRIRHAPGQPGHGMGSALRTLLGYEHHAALLQTGDCRDRCPDGRRQVADDPVSGAHSQRAGCAGGRGAASDAVRRPHAAGVPAFRHARGPGASRVHDRGTRGVRTAPGQRLRSLRRHRLRAHPGGGGAGGGSDPLGRGEQRHPLLSAEPASRRRGPASGRARAQLPSGGDQLPPGRSHHREQGGDGRSR